MAKKKYFTFALFVPLCLKRKFEIDTFKEDLQAVSFNLDFEHDFVNVSMRSKSGLVLEFPEKCSFDYVEDENFLLYDSMVVEYIERMSEYVQKKNEFQRKPKTVSALRGRKET